MKFSIIFKKLYTILKVTSLILFVLEAGFAIILILHIDNNIDYLFTPDNLDRILSIIERQQELMYLKQGE